MRVDHGARIRRAAYASETHTFQHGLIVSADATSDSADER